MKLQDKNIKQLKVTMWNVVTKYIKLKFPVCQLCNNQLSIHTHHIIKKSVCEYLRFDLTNLLAVCGTFHNKLHPTTINKKNEFVITELMLKIRDIIGMGGIDYLEKYTNNKN